MSDRQQYPADLISATSTQEEVDPNSMAFQGGEDPLSGLGTAVASHSASHGGDPSPLPRAISEGNRSSSSAALVDAALSGMGRSNLGGHLGLCLDDDNGRTAEGGGGSSDDDGIDLPMYRSFRGAISCNGPGSLQGGGDALSGGRPSAATNATVLMLDPLSGPGSPGERSCAWSAMSPEASVACTTHSGTTNGSAATTTSSRKGKAIARTVADFFEEVATPEFEADGTTQKRLGKGTSATVYLMTLKETQEVVAVKTYNGFEEQKMIEASRELKAMKVARVHRRRAINANGGSFVASGAHGGSGPSGSSSSAARDSGGAPVRRWTMEGTGSSDGSNQSAMVNGGGGAGATAAAAAVSHSDYVLQPRLACACRSSNAVYLVLPLMSGHLGDFAMRRLPEDVVRAIAVMLCRGQAHLEQDLRILHRDFKPSNCLYDKNSGAVKIADFGSSVALEPNVTTNQTFIGSMLYFSPERCRGEAYDHRSETWSFGITIAQLALGHHPFQDAMGTSFNAPSEVKFWSLMEIFGEDCAQVREIIGEAGFSPDLAHLVVSCLQFDAKDRPLPSSLLSHHPFLATGDAGFVPEAILASYLGAGRTEAERK